MKRFNAFRSGETAGARPARWGARLLQVIIKSLYSPAELPVTSGNRVLEQGSNDSHLQEEERFDRSNGFSDLVTHLK